MANTAALFGVLGAIVRPGLVVPHVVVRSVASLDWQRLHANGVRRVVFDKDNCLTKPHSDHLEPTLAPAWQDCLDTFGPRNVLIVSNSAGSSDDVAGLGAENLSRELGVPVLAHASKKPSGRCVNQILDALGEEHHLLVVGDRITTDTVLAHRINDALRKRRGKGEARALSSSDRDAEQRETGTTSTTGTGTSNGAPQAIAALTTQLWQKEAMGIRLLRRIEDSTRTSLVRRGFLPGRGRGGNVEMDWQFVAERIEDPTARASDAIAPLSDSNQTGGPRQAPEPTLLGFVAAQESLPPALTKVLRAMQTISHLPPLAWLGRMFREGWALIGRGIVEGFPSSLGGVRGDSQAGTGPGSTITTSRRRKAEGGLQSLLSIGGQQRRPRAERITVTGVGSSNSSSSCGGALTGGRRDGAQQRASYTTRSGDSSNDAGSGPAPRKLPLRNWLAAFAALLIMPLGYLGGQYVWDYRHSSDVEVAAKKEEEEEPSRMSQSSREGKEERERERAAADIEAKIYAIERELIGVREKLGKVRERGGN